MNKVRSVLFCVLDNQVPGLKMLFLNKELKPHHMSNWKELRARKSKKKSHFIYSNSAFNIGFTCKCFSGLLQVFCLSCIWLNGVYDSFDALFSLGN